MPKFPMPPRLPLSKHELIDEVERLREELVSAKADSKFRQELHNTLSGAMNIGYWEWDEIKHRPILFSKEMADILGVSQESLYEQCQCYEDYLKFIHPDDKIRVRNSLNIGPDSSHPGGYSRTLDYRIVRPGGEVRSIRELEHAILDDNGIVIRTYGAIQDISDQSRSALALEKSEQRYSSMFSQLPLGVQEQDWSRVKIGIDKLRSEGVSDLEGYLKDNPSILQKLVDSITIVSVNDALLKIYDTKSAELFIETEENVADWWDQSFANLYASEIATFAGPDKVHCKELKDTRTDGSAFVVRLITRVVEGDEDTWNRILTIAEDVTERKEAQEKLSYQASHDVLTGLINRSEFEQRTKRLLSTIQTDKAEHAMCFLDLDQFKIINDTCGHIAGDELLRQLGVLLRNTVRKRDTLARLGGDEFGVLMEHCTLDQAHRVADAVLDAVKGHQFTWEGETFRIGVSIGLIGITEAFGNYTDLFKQADVACYLAKELGRNRIHVYHPDDVELAVRQGEMQWVSRIHQALDEDRFCLYAQPIVSLDSDGSNHYELLVRMLGEQNEIIPPGAFLPAAERYNLIERIDTWVVEHAISLMVSNSIFIEQVNFISINLSGQSVANDQFMPMVIALIAESNIDARKICFEVTETAAISNLLAANTFIIALKDLGCRFALDDFGSGLSSFGYLKNLPVDYLKIDGMFVKDMVDDPIDKAMVRSINDIGHVMGMKTIAEFVENDAIMEQLKEIGVDYVQGYGIGKPEPFNEVISQF